MRKSESSLTKGRDQVLWIESSSKGLRFARGESLG